MDRRNWADTHNRKRTALITGATTVLGYELSRLFARDGFDLVLVDRDEARLSFLASRLRERYGIAVHAMPLDLTDPAASERLYDELQSRWVVVDVLVNNPWPAVHGLFSGADARDRDELKMMQLGIVAPAGLMRLFLPGMRHRRWGRVLNVTFAPTPAPGMQTPIAGASRAFMLSLCKALCAELKGTGVTVTVLCPSPPVRLFRRRSRSALDRLLLEAGAIARAGYRGLIKGKSVVAPGVFNRLTLATLRFVPSPVAGALAKWLYGG
jgi:short-subunit dehydrogenase